MLRPVAPVLDYCFNYQYIVTQLCVNKDKPQLKCNGKCYLMQQLLKQGKEDQESKKTSRIQLENYPIGFVMFLRLKKQPSLVYQEAVNTFYFNPYQFLEVREHFHPPSMLV